MTQSDYGPAPVRYVIYALPFVLAFGVIAAGAASWRALAGKLAVLLGIIAIAGSAYMVYEAERLIARVQEGLQQFEEGLEGLGNLDELAP